MNGNNNNQIKSFTIAKQHAYIVTTTTGKQCEAIPVRFASLCIDSWAIIKSLNICFFLNNIFFLILVHYYYYYVKVKVCAQFDDHTEHCKYPLQENNIMYCTF